MLKLMVDYLLEKFSDAVWFFRGLTTDSRTALVVEAEIYDVMFQYLEFLNMIASVIRQFESAGKRVDIDKRKFFAVRKEFFNFLLAHEKHFELNWITLKLADLVVFKMNTSVVADGENFLTIEDVLNFAEVIKSTDPKPTACFGIKVIKKRLLKP